MKTYLSDRFVRYIGMNQFRISKNERYQMITGSPPIAHKDHMISFISYVTYQIDHMVHMSGKFGRNIIFHTTPINYTNPSPNFGLRSFEICQCPSPWKTQKFWLRTLDFGTAWIRVGSSDLKPECPSLLKKIVCIKIIWNHLKLWSSVVHVRFKIIYWVFYRDVGWLQVILHSILYLLWHILVFRCVTNV